MRLSGECERAHSESGEESLVRRLTSRKCSSQSPVRSMENATTAKAQASSLLAQRGGRGPASWPPISHHWHGARPPVFSNSPALLRHRFSDPDENLHIRAVSASASCMTVRSLSPSVCSHCECGDWENPHQRSPPLRAGFPPT